MAPGAATRWFTRVTWLGIVANLGLSLPTLFAPERMVALTGLPTPESLLWLRFSALLNPASAAEGAAAPPSLMTMAPLRVPPPACIADTCTKWLSEGHS